jgi:hypothetical protein
MPVQVIRPIEPRGGRKAPASFKRIPENDEGVAKWIKSAKVEPKEPRPKESTMRMRMLRTVHAGVDGGIRVQLFEAGKVYDIEPALVESFLRCGHAEEDKCIMAAPETKDEKPVVIPEPPITKPHKRKGGRR